MRRGREARWFRSARTCASPVALRGGGAQACVRRSCGRTWWNCLSKRSFNPVPRPDVEGVLGPTDYVNIRLVAVTYGAGRQRRLHPPPPGDGARLPRRCGGRRRAGMRSPARSACTSASSATARGHRCARARTLRELVRRANAAGALATTRRGRVAALPTEAEVRHCLPARETTAQARGGRRGVGDETERVQAEGAAGVREDLHRASPATVRDFWTACSRTPRPRARAITASRSRNPRGPTRGDAHLLRARPRPPLPRRPSRAALDRPSRPLLRHHRVPRRRPHRPLFRGLEEPAP